MTYRPPKPVRKAAYLRPWRYLRAFRRDLLSSQPERLFSAKMAEFRTPFFRSFLLNEPDLIDMVLKERPRDFPKSDRVGEGLRPLLRDAVFLTNDAVWERQRRIIDPAFAGGRVRASLPMMQAAADAMIARAHPGLQDIEPLLSHTAADVIFRTLFSVPIEDDLAGQVFSAFRDYQRRQPILNLGAFFRLPAWMPRGIGRETRLAAQAIRTAIAALVDRRLSELSQGTAPDDLVSKIMTTPDPETGQRFSREEIIDQVAIFFLAGHETSASALSWAVFLLSRDHAVQARAAAEARRITALSDFAQMGVLRDVLRETLRLYPPVPMMVRETRRPEPLRNREAPVGAPLVLSPWHLHRNPRYWDNPDVFDPERFSRADAQEAQRRAYLPFSAGPRICPGAGFAMAEMVVILSELLRHFTVVPGPEPVPVAHLTIRGRDGIRVALQPRTP